MKRTDLIRKRVKQVIEIIPSHWFHLKDKSFVPDVTYAFYQTLELKYGISPKNNAEVRLIRKIFHEVYINEYKGVYKLDLKRTFASPLVSIIGVKKLEYYRYCVTHTKNVSIKKRLELIRKRK
jgi:hypothetical protein